MANLSRQLDKYWLYQTKHNLIFVKLSRHAAPRPLDHLRDALAADIAAGRHAPGERLPSEAQLAQRFGVNRHTVRRALAALAEDGLVQARRGAGVFVTGPGN
jgi:DNA-binding GntR family transcriptional regulator